VSLRYCALGSGSRGNALLVESGATLLMIDCGLSRRAFEERIAAIGRSPEDLTALLITHEHSDHCRGLPALARRYGHKIYMTQGTASAIAHEGPFEPLNSHRPLNIGSILIEPFPVPHDAREPCQFVFSANGKRLGLLTDTGRITPHIEQSLDACDALALEFNHDVDRLMRGTYPAAVKARVASHYGHLSNAQAATLVSKFVGNGLQDVLALHISEQNNTPALVTHSVAETRSKSTFNFHLATQDTPTQWYEIL